jgi:hypothetical protein
MHCARDRFVNMCFAAAFLLVIGILAVEMFGCKEPRPGGACGTYLDTRCRGNLVEVCDPAGEWTIQADCGELTPGTWHCAEVGETRNEGGVEVKENFHNCIQDEPVIAPIGD